jgi:16S rRNA (guanine966-N2)-methyltransferase
VPRGLSVRPTTSKVRKAIFDILGQRCDGDQVLDLYAGSGSLGLEAARRGAARVVFVENADVARRALEENIRRANSPCPTELLFRDAVEGLGVLSGRGDTFDIVLADPPYDRGEVQRLLERLDRSDLLADEGVAVVEHSPRERGEDTLERLRRIDERRYGQTHISFFTADETRPHDDTKRR